MKINPPSAFTEVPARVYGRQGSRDSLLQQLRELPVKSKIEIDLEESDDFQKQVNSISTKIKRKGALEGKYCVRSNKTSRQITVYRTE